MRHRETCIIVLNENDGCLSKTRILTSMKLFFLLLILEFYVLTHYDIVPWLDNPNI